MSRSSLGIFLKIPRPGRVKTRIARSLGVDAATSLYTALLQDTVTLASLDASRQLHLFVDGGRWEAAWGPEGFSGPDHEHPQAEGDLGDRLTDAFERAHDVDPSPLLVLGSDSPDLPATHLESALGALDRGSEVVLGPVEDGGVWCIGLDRPRPEFLRSIPWSDSSTGAALRRRAEDLGLSIFDADGWFDCDEAVDLKALALRLRDEPTAARATRAWLEAQPSEDQR